MLGNLGENLTKTMKKLVGMSVIDKKTIKEVVKEIQGEKIVQEIEFRDSLKPLRLFEQQKSLFKSYV